MASIEKRNGKWRARWRTPGGDSRSATFTRKVEAERHLVAVEAAKLRGSYIDPSAGRTTVGEYWQQWSGRQHWRPRSRLQAESLWRNHIEPGLGAGQLNRLRRGDVEAFAAGLPVAPRTARQIVQYVSSLLDGAVGDGLLAANPARGAKRPRVDAEPVSPFTAKNIDALRAVAPDWFEVALDLGLGAGLRQSEAAGLTVDRVDFLRRRLVVDRQLAGATAGAPHFGPPKTKRGYRTVPLADAVVEALARHVERSGAGPGGVLLHKDGAVAVGWRFDYAWARLRDRAGLAGSRYHNLRHTYASTLLSGGVSVPAVAEYLGHSPAELLRTYAHLLPADHDRARAVVEAAFSTSRVPNVSRGVSRARAEAEPKR